MVLWVLCKASCRLPPPAHLQPVCSVLWLGTSGSTQLQGCGQWEGQEVSRDSSEGGKPMQASSCLLCPPLPGTSVETETDGRKAIYNLAHSMSN